MASEYQIAIKIAGQLDKSLSSAVSGAQKQLQGLSKSQSVSQGLKTIGNTMTTVGASLTAGITTPIVGLSATSVKEFGDVDKTLKLVASTMGDAKWQAGDLEGAMKKAAAASVFGMQDAADASLNFARQGFNAKQASDMLTPALDLAAGTETDLSEVTGGLGNALKMFGKNSDYASTAADILAKAQAQANTTTHDLFEAFAVAGPIVNSVGWNMQDLATITDVLGDAGISGSEGATALKTGLARLASPADEGAKWMKKLGLNIFNADGSMKNMVDVQKQLHDSFGKLTQEQQLQAASAIFGKNQMAKWMTLIQASPKTIQKYSDALNKTNGEAHSMADSLMSGMGGSLEKLSSSFDVMKYNIGQILSEVLKPFVDRLTGLIDKFNSLDPAMQKNIVKWAMIAAAAGPVLIVGGRLFKLAGSIVGVFGKVGSAVSKVVKHTKGAQKAVQQNNSVMSAAAKNVLGFGAGFGMAAAGVWLLVQAAKTLVSAGPAAAVALGIMAGGIIAMMAIASKLGPQLQASATGFIAFGGGILMAAGGMSLMAMAATQIAAAGPLAVAALSIMTGGMIALLAVAGAMGPALTAGAAGFLALGGAILMVSAGFALLVNSAIQLASAGTGAQVAMAAMGVGIAALAGVFALLGPALLIATPGMLAFGAAVLMVGSGVAIASAGITLLAASLPAIAAGAPAAAAGFITLGTAVVTFGALCTAGSAGILVLIASLAGLAAGALAGVAGIAAATVAMAAFAVSVLAVNAGMIPLSAAMAIVSASVLVIAASAKAAGTALRGIAKGAAGTAAKMAVIAAGAAPLAAALVPLAASATATAAALLAVSVGGISAAAAITLLGAGIGITAAALTAASGAIALFRTAALGLPAITGPTVASFTQMSAAILPFSVAVQAAAVPLLAVAAAMVTMAAGTVTAATAMTVLAAEIPVVTAALATFPTTTTAAMTAMVAALTVGGAAAVAQARNTVSQINGAFTPLGSMLMSSGMFAMQGLRNGIARGGAAAVAQARTVARQVTTAVNSALQIHSPSKVMEKSGQFTGLGLAKGMRNESGLVQRSASQYLAQPVMQGASDSSVLSSPEFTQGAQSSVIPTTVDNFSGTGTTQTTAPATTNDSSFVYSPVFNIQGSGVSKDDVVQANKMGMDEFAKLMRQYKRSEGRKAFA